MNVESLARRRPEPADNDPRPTVAPPAPGLPGIAIASIAALAAVVLFLMLDGQRRHRETAGSHAGRPEAGAIASPAPLVVPPEVSPAPPPPTPMVIPVERTPDAVQLPPLAPPAVMPLPAPAPPAAVSHAPADAAAGLSEPALVYDAGATAGDAKATTAPQPGQTSWVPTGQPETSPASGSAHTGRIASASTVVPTGTLILAVLETPVDTSRPGLARAIVSKDARGFDGRRVLIPRGSRLIGEYDAEVRTGQEKVLVNWTQLVRPDGVTIRLNSPAADAMGGAGVPGKVDNFFFQRFSNAVLQTALTVGASPATWTNNASVIVGIPAVGASPASAVAGQGGLVGQPPQPRIKIKEGAAFNVFVARDLDFSGAPAWRER
jgi:type IV secretion system protein VirB10